MIVWIQRLLDFIENNRGLFVFFFMSVTVFLLKHSAFQYNFLVYDDLSLFGDSIDKNIGKGVLYLKVYSLINQLLLHPTHVRFAYMLMYAFISTIFCSLLGYIFSNKLIPVYVTLLAMLHPSTSVLINFINGSYNLLFLFTFVLGLLFLFKYLFDDSYKCESWNRRFFLFFSLMLLTISPHLSTSAMLLPLGVVFLPWWSSFPFKRNKRVFLFEYFSLVLIICLSILYSAFSFKHPYQGHESRIDFSLYEMLQRSIAFLCRYFQFYINPIERTGLDYEINGVILQGWMFSFFAIITLILLLNFTLLLKSKKTSSQLLPFVPFFILSIILSIGPLSVINLYHIWYFHLPGIFIVILFLGMQFEVVANRYLNFIIFVFLLFLSMYSVLKQQEKYSTIAEIEQGLVSLINNEEFDWISESQVLILTDDTDCQFGFRDKIRSRKFFNFNSNKNLVDVIITSENDWNTRIEHKNTFFKRSGYMEGVFDKDKPIYIYHYDYISGVYKRLYYCIIEIDNVSKLYSLTEGYPRVAMDCSASDLYFKLSEKKINYFDCLHYRFSGGTDDELSSANANNFKFHIFSGNNSEVYSLNTIDNVQFIGYVFILRSSRKIEERANISNMHRINPPMPFISKPIFVYQKDNYTYSLQIKTSSNGKEENHYILLDVDTNEWNKISIIFDNFSMKVYVYVNDVLYSIMDDCPWVNAENNRIILGKGHFERYWTGEMASFKIKTEKGDLFDFNQELRIFN